jgi:hypothetical protein
MSVVCRIDRTLTLFGDDNKLKADRIDNVRMFEAKNVRIRVNKNIKPK